MIDTVTVHVYLREPMKIRASRRKKRDALNHESDGILDIPKPFTEFIRVRQIDFSKWISPGENGTSSPPCFYSCVNKNLLVFGFVDGTIRVIKCCIISDEEYERIPILITEFFAHVDCTILSIVPVLWSTVHGGAYFAEFLSVGRNHEIAHWGLRSRFIYIYVYLSLSLPLNPISIPS